MIALKNVLVAIDFGDPSMVAFAYGRDLARTFGATLHVIHVVDDVGTKAAAMAGYGIDFERIQAEMEEAAREQLDGLLSDEDRQQLGATVAIVSAGGTANAIVEYARAHHINLIVIGTHGLGAVAHLFVGSVAERVVRQAPCPVLTVRQPEVEFVLPDALQRVEVTSGTGAAH